MAKDIEKQRARNRQAMARRYSTPEGKAELLANNERWRKSPEGRAKVLAAAARRRRKYPFDVFFRSTEHRARLQGVEFTR